MKTGKKCYSVVTNQYDNKEYIVSTLPWNKTREIPYAKNKFTTETFIADSMVRKKKGIFTSFKPIVLVKAADKALLSQADLHSLVCDLAQKKHIEDLLQPETYLIHGKDRYFATQEDVFSVFAMRKKRVVYILLKL